jgi:hypothetical protein
MARIFPRPEGMGLIHDSGIVDFHDCLALPEEPLGKDAESIDRRRATTHFSNHFLDDSR